MRKIVILGAGYAGVLTAKMLAKRLRKLKKDSEFEVSIIDRHPFHTMLTELHEVAARRVDEDSVKISLAKVFAGRKVNVVTDNISRVDFENKTVVGANGQYPYDWLVMGTGSKPAFYGVKGAADYSFTLWSYEDAVKLRDHILNMFRLASCETDAGKRKELLTFFVVGAGFTGVEMAGELAELIPALCGRFEIDPKDVTMFEADLLERCCMVLPEKQSAKLAKRLVKMGVNLMLKTDITEMGEGYLIYKKDGKAQTVKTNTVIWTAGVEGSALAFESKALEQAGRGRIATDEYLRSKSDKSVFVVGDNIFYIPENEKAPVPQMVENAEASAETAAHNLLADALGAEKPEKYAPVFHGVMVCVGGRYGAANVGFPGRMFTLPSFLAMFTKHFVNILYFIKVLGWNKIYSYLYHEFFTVRDKRSFTGGYFSNRSATFFTVPLRVFLGFYWVYEGVNKALQGWLQGPELTNYFNGANKFFSDILNGVTVAADATSSATTAGAAGGLAGTVLINWNILGLARVILVNGSQAAFKLQVGMADWFVNTFVMHSSPMQNTMQYVIVLSEILVGLALMGGLFTTAAAAWSLVLQMLFITSTGIYMDTWWMVFAGVAVMFGAGRVFSLDYYVMPLLKERWKKIKFVRKWYLYND